VRGESRDFEAEGSVSREVREGRGCLKGTREALAAGGPVPGLTTLVAAGLGRTGVVLMRRRVSR
jgi:hypothetical protein